MKWLQALGKAALAGGVIACAPIAASMAADGFTKGEFRVLVSTLVSGALGGLSGLFVNQPRDPGRRQRVTDVSQEVA